MDYGLRNTYAVELFQYKLTSRIQRSCTSLEVNQKWPSRKGCTPTRISVRRSTRYNRGNAVPRHVNAISCFGNCSIFVPAVAALFL
uniref:Uncharacterized protein n=1 Tax=Pararge aegeria TaxID=116150 RepID=S4NR27_9NEOP